MKLILLDYLIIVAHSLYKNDAKYVKIVDTLEVETVE